MWLSKDIDEREGTRGAATGWPGLRCKRWRRRCGGVVTAQRGSWRLQPYKEKKIRVFFSVLGFFMNVWFFFVPYFGFN